MSALYDFLLANPVADLKEEVVISPRLKDFPFTIRGVTAKEMDDYSHSCQKVMGGKTGFDGEKFNLLLILNHCEMPDFRNAKLLQKAGCERPEDLVNQVLKAGEMAALAKAIYRLSGYDQSMEELKDTVKN